MGNGSSQWRRGQLKLRYVSVNNVEVEILLSEQPVDLCDELEVKKINHMRIRDHLTLKHSKLFQDLTL